MTQNSALRQNWVGCTRCTPWPSLRVQAMRTTPRPAMSRSCRGHVVGLCPAVSWLVVGRVASLAGHVVGLDPASRALRALSHASLAVSRIVSQRKVVSQPLYRRPLSRYKLCIVTQAPVARRLCVSESSYAAWQDAGNRTAALAALYRDSLPGQAARAHRPVVS